MRTQADINNAVHDFCARYGHEALLAALAAAKPSPTLAAQNEYLIEQVRRLENRIKQLEDAEKRRGT
jgi:hypothetical protein